MRPAMPSSPGRRHRRFAATPTPDAFEVVERHGARPGPSTAFRAIHRSRRPADRRRRQRRVWPGSSRSPGRSSIGRRRPHPRSSAKGPRGGGRNTSKVDRATSWRPSGRTPARSGSRSGSSRRRIGPAVDAMRRRDAGGPQGRARTGLRWPGAAGPPATPLIGSPGTCSTTPGRSRTARSPGPRRAASGRAVRGSRHAARGPARLHDIGRDVRQARRLGAEVGGRRADRRAAPGRRCRHRTWKASPRSTCGSAGGGGSAPAPGGRGAGRAGSGGRSRGGGPHRGRRDRRPGGDRRRRRRSHRSSSPRGRGRRDRRPTRDRAGVGAPSSRSSNGSCRTAERDPQARGDIVRECPCPAGAGAARARPVGAVLAGPRRERRPAAAAAIHEPLGREAGERRARRPSAASGSIWRTGPGCRRRTRATPDPRGSRRRNQPASVAGRGPRSGAGRPRRPSGRAPDPQRVRDVAEVEEAGRCRREPRPGGRRDRQAGGGHGRRASLSRGRSAVA